MTTKQKIWTTLISAGMTAAGAAGLMGNLHAESALKPKNLQNSYEKKLGYTDATYTKAVDSNEYQEFAIDCAGYGLAQWTHHTRKAALLAMAQARRVSVGNLDLQLDYLLHELRYDFTDVMALLCTTQDVREASDAVMLDFERPADTSESARAKRAEYAQQFYGEFAGTVSAPAPAEPETFMVVVTCHALNVRCGPGMDHGIKQVVKRGEAFTIVETASVDGSTWGRLKSGAGWINIDPEYCKRA